MARRTKEESYPKAQEGDYGTPEARRQAFHVVEQPDPQDRSTRRLRVSTGLLEWYLRRNYITRVQADALLRWQSDAYMAGLLPACISSYGQTIIGGVMEYSERKVAAITRRANAIKYLQVFGPHAVPIVDAVTVNEKPAGRWIMEQLGGTPREGMQMLERYSTALTKHYGLTR